MEKYSRKYGMQSYERPDKLVQAAVTNDLQATKLSLIGH